MPLDTAHQQDGEIATANVLEHLQGLPQDRPDEEHGQGAERRMQWLKDNDFEALFNDMKKLGIKKVWRRDQFKTPSLSRSNRQRYLNEIARQHGLASEGEWQLVNRRNTTKKNNKK